MTTYGSKCKHMTFESGLSFFIAIFIFAITPGPGVFALLARSIAFNTRSCVPLAFGMSISDSLYLVMACWGLATIAENWGTLFTLIRLVGAAYLIYLGWKMWTLPVKPPIQSSKYKYDKDQNESLALFLQGVLISASNPKVILFYIAFLPTFMDLSILQMGDIVTVVILDLSALMAGLMMIVFGAARAKGALQSSSALKRLNRVAGSIMAGAGLYLATRN